MSGRVVIVGASVGGVRAAQGLRAAGYGGEVVVVGAERELPYDKPPLSKQVLTGASTADDIRLATSEELDDAGITVRLGAAAGAVDLGRRRLELVDGDHVAFDDLVIATGVRPRTLETPGDVVHTLRTFADAVTLRDRLLSTGGPLVVIGGGFIGAEVAASAAALGIPTTIVEALPAPFSRVLGTEVGALVERLHRAHDVEVIAGVGVVGIDAGASGRATVRLADGRALGAAVVVAGIGCVPNTEWLSSSGLVLDDGVVTDEHCRARGAERVYAIGDVARWFDVRTGTHRRVEHWTHAFQQAQLVAHNIAHPDDLQTHLKAPYFWSDQHGVKIQMVGHLSGDDDVEVLCCSTPVGPRDVAIYSKEGHFTAGVAFGWPQVVPRLRRAWEQQAGIDEVRQAIGSTAA